MAHVGVEDVNTWLEPSKLSVSEIEPGLDVYATGLIVGALVARFDTTTWVDETTTPSLVKQLISMLYAAAFYRREYSEDLVDGTGLNWAQWLEQSAGGYVSQIVAGVIDIIGLPDGTDEGLALPAFYPTDESSIDDPAKFSMCMRF